MIIRFLTLVSIVTICASAAWAQSSKIMLAGKTQAKADAGERVRVIVDYAIPAAETPKGKAGVAATARRTLIAAGRESLLERTFGGKAFNYNKQKTLEAVDNPSVVRILNNVPAMAMRLTRSEMEKLAADPAVIKIYTDQLSRPNLDESTVLIGAPTVWNAGSDGADYAVAVLDTGSSHDHVMMSGKVVGSACFSAESIDDETESLCPNGSVEQLGLPAGTNCPVDDPATPDITEGIDGCDHGTHVASTAMGSAFTLSSTPRTVAGVARGANLVAIQVFTKFNKASDCSDDEPPNEDDAPCVQSFDSDQLAGLDFVLDNTIALKIASANMSLGGGESETACDNDALKSLIDQLRTTGVATVIAAGNESFTNAVSNPGCISTAITVGATSKSDVVAGFSNSSSLVDVLAPGVSILAAYPQVAGINYGATLSGTSMATPHVAGAFALLRSAHPTATVQQIEDALKATGKPVVDTKNQLSKPRIRVDLASDFLANGGSEAGDLAIAPFDGFGASGTAGVSASFGTMAYTLTNNGAGNLDWTASVDKPFIVLDKPGGTLAGGASETVIVSIDAQNLLGGTAGSDDGAITFAVGAESATRFVGASASFLANNNFADALPLTGIQPSITGSSANADKEPDEPNHIGGANAGGASIWYKWVAPLSTMINVSTAGSSFDTVLGAYTGTALNALTAKGNNDDEDNPNGILTSLISFDTVAGTNYFFAVDGFNGASGDVVLSVSIAGAAANDNFATPTMIAGNSGSANGNNVNATAEAGEPAHGGAPAAQSIWFDWTAPSDGSFTFNTDGSDFANVLSVYTGSSLAALSPIGAEAPSSGIAGALSVANPAQTQNAKFVTFNAVTGTNHHIAIDGVSGANGLVKLGWTSSATPLPNLVTAVLPYARSVKVGAQATAFMTVINAGSVEGTNCFIGLEPGSFQGGFTYQTTDAGNAPIGSPDTPVTIAGSNGVQNFVFAITPSAVLNQQELGIQASCNEGTSSNVTVGVNSFILSAAQSNPADMLTIGLTATGDGTISIPGPSGAAAAAIATSALGADADLTLSADDGGSGLPLALFVCETNPVSGACLAPPAATVDIASVNGETRTFAVFANASGDIVFSPGQNRVFLRFKDVGGVVRGATNFAVRTDAP